MNQREQLTIEILIASAIQGKTLEQQRNILIATILYLVDRGRVK